MDTNKNRSAKIRALEKLISKTNTKSGLAEIIKDNKSTKYQSLIGPALTRLESYDSEKASNKLKLMKPYMRKTRKVVNVIKTATRLKKRNEEAEDRRRTAREAILKVKRLIPNVMKAFHGVAHHAHMESSRPILFSHLQGLGIIEALRIHVSGLLDELDPTSTVFGPRKYSLEYSIDFDVCKAAVKNKNDRNKAFMACIKIIPLDDLIDFVIDIIKRQTTSKKTKPDLKIALIDAFEDLPQFFENTTKSSTPWFEKFYGEPIKRHYFEIKNVSGLATLDSQCNDTIGGLAHKCQYCGIEFTPEPNKCIFSCEHGWEFQIMVAVAGLLPADSSLAQDQFWQHIGEYFSACQRCNMEKAAVQKSHGGFIQYDTPDVSLFDAFRSNASGAPQASRMLFTVSTAAINAFVENWFSGKNYLYEEKCKKYKSHLKLLSGKKIIQEAKVRMTENLTGIFGSLAFNLNLLFSIHTLHRVGTPPSSSAPISYTIGSDIDMTVKKIVTFGLLNNLRPFLHVTGRSYVGP
jgi:hypothetical protein